MTSSMKAYLAAKYMSGPKADAILSRTTDGAPKKKKRKTAHASSSTSVSASFIKDDDILGWDSVLKEQEEDDSTEAVVASDRGFKKKQPKEGDAGWATVREGEKKDDEDVPMDERPQVVDEDKPFRGGLMSAEQLRKTFKKNTQATELTQEEIAAAQETIYRDASGRKVDLEAERAEAARKKREKEEKERKKMEWGKGLVQREELEKRKQEQEKLKGRGFARTVDDVEMNEELKAQDRWNDPAAAFLSVSSIAIIPCWS